MKTIIDENGCSSHPHGGNVLEIKVPLTINGTNVVEQLEEFNSKLSSLVLEINEKLQSYEQSIKTLEEKLVAATVITATSTDTAETTTAAIKSIKKTPTKTTTTTEQV